GGHEHPPHPQKSQPCPPMSALMAGAAPLKGTKVGFAPTMELNRSPQVNPIEPTPACPMFSFWAFAFTYEINSWRSLAGKSLLATIITGAQPDKPIGAKSTSGL